MNEVKVVKMSDCLVDSPDTNLFLLHHGIKNQKWGVRNGPPYPLDDDLSTGKRLKRNLTKEEKKEQDEKLVKLYGPRKGKTTIDISSDASLSTARKAALTMGVLGGAEAVLKVGDAPGEATKAVSEFRSSAESEAKKSFEADAKAAMKKGKEIVDLTPYSQAEIAAWNKRLETEKKYRDLTVTDVEKGQEKAYSLLDTTAKLIGIGVAGATLYAILKKARS